MLSTFNRSTYATDDIDNVSWTATDGSGRVTLRHTVFASGHWSVRADGMGVDGNITSGREDTVADAIAACVQWQARRVRVMLYQVATIDKSTRYEFHLTMRAARAAAVSRSRLTGEKHCVVTLA
jgi:hypothetical protein